MQEEEEKKASAVEQEAPEGETSAAEQVAHKPLELHLVRLSAPCRAVWLYLLQHDIPHVLIDVDFEADTSVKEFVSKCPHKEVPILVDGDVMVFEAPVILRYLATQYTHYAGYGVTLQNRMLAESVICWANTELHRSVGHCYAYPAFLEKYRLPSEEANEMLIERGIKEMTKYLERLETDYLGSRKYLVGDTRVTVADSFVATVLLQAEWNGFGFKMWPKVQSWLRRVRAQEYWAEVHAAHRKLVTDIENAPFDF